MLKSSEFNSAVPKFTNGNYASNPLDPTNIEEPSAQDYVRGAEPLDTLPAQWWNWLCNQFTSRFNKLNTYVKNIFDELTGFLSLLNITPDGTESAITTGQLKNAFKEDYPAYINSKLELGTTYVKKTQKVNNHALTGDITVTKSDVGLGNVPNVTTNNQTPTYTVASSLTNLTSGEVLSTAFGKIAKAVSSIISHIANVSNPHSVTKAQVGLGSVVNTGDSATPVENGTTKFTTGGAYTEFKTRDEIMQSLPTDAVLHYSFDEVPDYPDGTADVRLIDNNTYQIQSTSNTFRSNGGTVISNENGNLKCVITGGTWTGCYINKAGIQNKIVKIRIKVTDIVGTLGISIDAVASGNLKSITETGVYEVVELHPSTEGNSQLFFWCVGTGNSCTFIVEQIYIGDGTYSTPIIDNANGEWNSVSQSGVAVSGVSGKGLKCFQNNRVNFGDYFLQDNFTVSIWVNPENNTADLQSECIYRYGHFVLRNGWTGNNKLVLFLYAPNDVTLINAGVISDLLSPNIWTHIVITKNNLTVCAYINGSKVKTFTVASSQLRRDSSTSSFSVNATINTQPQSYDDLLIFDRALTDTEVKALYYNKANTPKYYGDVPVTRTVNGQTLDKDIVLDKTDVGLTNVVNTGDSNSPALNGTDKFTTGGAYNLLLNLAPAFSTSTAYAVNQLVTYNGTLYKCTTAHSAGTWNASHFTAVTLNDVAGVTGVKGDSESAYRKGNVNVTKANVGLGNVSNTGDSATPVSGGTTKFTTGGAYTELNKKFDKTSAGDQVTYSLSGNTLTITSK